MRKKISSIIIIICISITIVGIIIDILPDFYSDTMFKFFTYILPILILLIEMVYCIRKENTEQEKQKIKTKFLWIIFGIYIMGLIALLFFSSTYRIRINDGEELSPVFSLEHIKTSVNLIPFKTIENYIGRLFSHTINTGIVIVNIIGNLVAFAPFGFLIPMLYKEKIKIGKYTIIMALVIIGVEFTQFITRVGQADIDDLILNLFGTVITFIIVKSKWIQNIISKIEN